MMRLHLNKYSVAASLLFVAGAAYIAIALIINPGEITTSAFVIAGLVCVMIGIFTLTFSAGEPIDPRLVGLLPAQFSLNINLLAKHIGVKGNAHFLPSRVTGEGTVVQFNPTSTYYKKQQGSFKETGPPGLVTPPSCELLIEDLRKNHALVIPNKKEELSGLIRETIEDVFKFAPQVSVQWAESKVTITFHEYLFIDGCKAIAEKSRTCCGVSPCPTCSLCGAFIAMGLDTVVSLDYCIVSSSPKDITASFILLP
jgi:hypothetical protein